VHIPAARRAQEVLDGELHAERVRHPSATRDHHGCEDGSPDAGADAELDGHVQRDRGDRPATAAAIHELAHHLGIDDDRLEELGLD
jgi:hypothetical protein